jgi:hypothetical protein
VESESRGTQSLLLVDFTIDADFAAVYTGIVERHDLDSDYGRSLDPDGAQGWGAPSGGRRNVTDR